MEAISGAIFLDAGFEPARDVVRAPVGEPRTTRTPTAPARRQVGPAGMGAGKGLAICRDYVEVEPQGPRPRAALHLRGAHRRQAPARGEGASKRAAEQAAARALLEREGVAGAELHE